MNRDIIVHESPKSQVSESVRLLRTNLAFLAPDKKNKVFLITSSVPGEGKSWVCANLAISFAQSNNKVLIIDADLRKGRQHRVFNIPNKMGLSDYLQGAAKVEDDPEIQDELLMKVIHQTAVPNLFLITAGSVPPNPSELLDTRSLDHLIETVREGFDIIIFDMPPVSIVADGLVLCKKVDFVLLVTASGVTRKDIVVNSKKSILNVGGKLAGVVLNMVPADKRKYYTKYYNSYSEVSLVSHDYSETDVRPDKKNRKRRG